MPASRRGHRLCAARRLRRPGRLQRLDARERHAEPSRAAVILPPRQRQPEPQAPAARQPAVDRGGAGGVVRRRAGRRSRPRRPTPHRLALLGPRALDGGGRRRPRRPPVPRRRPRVRGMAERRRAGNGPVRPRHRTVLAHRRLLAQRLEPAHLHARQPHLQPRLPVDQTAAGSKPTTPAARSSATTSTCSGHRPRIRATRATSRPDRTCTWCRPGVPLP